MNLAEAVTSPSWLDVEIKTDDRAARITISGEADISNQGYLEAALAGFEPTGMHEIRLRLSDLRFCEVRSICHLLTFASQMTESGCDVVVVEAAPVVELMMRLLQVDNALTFE